MEQQFFATIDRQEVTLSSGVSLSLEVAKPKTYGPYPAIVLCMGMYGVNGALKSTALLLAEKGFIVFVPDFYHQRFNGEPFCPGDLDEALDARHLLLLDSATAELREVLCLVEARRDVAQDRIAILGACMGGTLGILAAAQYNTKVCCASAIYPLDLEVHLQLLDRIGLPIQVIAAGSGFLSGGGRRGQIEAFLLARANSDYHCVGHARHGFLELEQPSADPMAMASALERVARFIATHARTEVTPA